MSVICMKFLLSELAMRIDVDLFDTQPFKLKTHKVRNSVHTKKTNLSEIPVKETQAKSEE